MMILFPRDKHGIKISLKLIFEAMEADADFSYVSGMIDFAQQFGAVTADEAQSLMEYLIERDRIKYQERGRR